MTGSLEGWVEQVSRGTKISALLEKWRWTEMRGERRRDLREPEKVKMIVNGPDHNGIAFEEQTETIDLSPAGLSFYLDTPIFIRSFLALDIDQNSFVAGKLIGLVVRIDTSRRGKQLVAAQ